MKDAFVYSPANSFEEPQTRQSPIQRAGAHLSVIAAVRCFCPFIFICICLLNNFSVTLQVADWCRVTVPSGKVIPSA